MIIGIYSSDLNHLAKINEKLKNFFEDNDIDADINAYYKEDQIALFDECHIAIIETTRYDINTLDYSYKIRDRFPNCLVIFLGEGTDLSYGENFYYIGKKFFMTHLEFCFKVLSHQLAAFDKISFTTKEKTRVYLPQRDITYIERNSRLTVIHTKRRSYEVREKLGTVYDWLHKDHFLRCHNSFIVYLPLVKEVRTSEVILDDETSVPMSRKYKRESVEQLEEWGFLIRHQ